MQLHERLPGEGLLAEAALVRRGLGRPDGDQGVELAGRPRRAGGQRHLAADGLRVGRQVRWGHGRGL